MAERIEADYEMLGNISARFQRQQELFAQIESHLAAKRVALENEWIGRGYAAFAQEMDSLVLPVVARVANAMQEAGAVTRQVAQIIQTAEEEAAGSFEVLA